jgi:polysaccharide deacetylase family protein (PEP-CTERM system associated)
MLTPAFTAATSRDMMLNALTIDVEDYYHVANFASVIRFEDWHRYDSRVERNTLRILDLLDAYGTKATFFVLGWVAERQPQLIRTIHQRGHEVASHGYTHRLVYTQTPAQFREETRYAKRLLEDTTGQAILGYRAASYSITARSLWALDVLAEEGFRYDSSISPIVHDRYGIPGANRFGHVLIGPAGAPLIELPPSTLRVGGVNIPMAGGGYFRLFPYRLTRWSIKRLLVREHQPAVVYLHPWELDTGQPRIQASALSRFRHYVNIAKVEARLTRLLREFCFAPVRDVLRQRGLWRDDAPAHPAAA